MSQNQAKSKKSPHPDWVVTVEGPIRVSTGLYRKNDVVRNFPEKAAKTYGDQLKRVGAPKADEPVKASKKAASKA